MKREAHSFRTSSTDDTKKKKRGRGDPCWVKQARGPLLGNAPRHVEPGVWRVDPVVLAVYHGLLKGCIATQKGIGSDEEPRHYANSDRHLHWL